MLDLSDVSSWLDLRYAAVAELSLKWWWRALFMASDQMTHNDDCPITGDINFDYWIRIESSSLLTIKWLPFRINKYFGGNTLKLYKYPILLKLSPTTFSIREWFLPELLTTMVVYQMVFLSPSSLLHLLALCCKQEPILIHIHSFIHLYQCWLINSHFIQ